LSLRSTPQRNFLKLHRLQKSFYNLLFFFKNLLHHKTHFACSVSPLRAAYAAPSAAQPHRQNV